MFAPGQIGKKPECGPYRSKAIKGGGSRPYGTTCGGANHLRWGQLCFAPKAHPTLKRGANHHCAYGVGKMTIDHWHWPLFYGSGSRQ
jgi:hypothetical protein